LAPATQILWFVPGAAAHSEVQDGPLLEDPPLNREERIWLGLFALAEWLWRAGSACASRAPV